MCKITPNNFWQYSLGVFLIVASIAGLIFGWSIYQHTRITSSPNRLTVTGEGKAYAKSDVAILELSVVTQNKDVKLVQTENDSKMQKVVNFLKESGIEEKDIKTTQYNLQPQYDYSWCRTSETPVYCPPKLVDYILTQTLEVKIRDFAKIGDIVGNLTSVGVNQISSINFTIENIDEIMAQARKQAIEKAQSKALAISQATGVKLGKIVEISEGNNYNPPLRTMMAKDVSENVSAPIEAGTNEITLNVSLTYEILK